LKISDFDENLISFCVKLHQETNVGVVGVYKNPQIPLDDLNRPKWYNFDEFSQAGIKQSVTFCMRLPGNNDLCTHDRAKLLKYGSYEIVLLRLASRYSLLDDKLVLSNDVQVSEQDLINYAFGCYGHTFFQFCKSLNRFCLTTEEMAVFEGFIFYTFDRPLIIERKKVEKLQMKYSEILRHLCAKNHKNDEMFFSKLLLSCMKLRALDALTAERMLNLILSYDKPSNGSSSSSSSSNNEQKLGENIIINDDEQNNNVEGYIIEVLHREYLNIVADLEIHSMDSIDTNPNYGWVNNKRSQEETTIVPVVNNLDTINYEDLIDCLTQQPSQVKIEQKPIQNLSEIFNKTVNNQNSINIQQHSTTTLTSNSFNHYHQQQPQLLNVLLVPGGGLGFLSVVKNNS
jgi:hypothetical protein